MKVPDADVSAADADWPTRIEITDPAAIALLTDLRGLRMLTPFMRTSHTLTSAARSLGRPASSLAHWVPRFVDTGLLERRGEVKRAGAPMPLYRTPARMLVIPFELIPFDTRVRMLDEGRLRLLRRFMDGMDEALAATRSFGFTFAPHGQEGTLIDVEETAAERAQRAFTDGWRSLELTEDDALEFSRELEQLVARYADRTGPNTYLCHAGVAPEPVFRWRSATDR